MNFAREQTFRKDNKHLARDDPFICPVAGIRQKNTCFSQRVANNESSFKGWGRSSYRNCNDEKDNGRESTVEDSGMAEESMVEGTAEAGTVEGIL